MREPHTLHALDNISVETIQRLVQREKTCDNISACHDPITLGETDGALRVICKQCKSQYTIHKHPVTGAPEMNVYAKIFKRDILQPKENLFYKIYPQYLQ